MFDLLFPLAILMKTKVRPFLIVLPVVVWNRHEHDVQLLTIPLWDGFISGVLNVISNDMIGLVLIVAPVFGMMNLQHAHGQRVFGARHELLNIITNVV